MKQITENLKGLTKEIVLGPLFKLLEAVLELFVPLVMADIIDKGIAGRDVAYIIPRGLLLLGIALVGGAMALTAQYYAARAAGTLGERLRGKLFAHIMRFSGAEADAFGSGSLITHLTNDVNQIQTGLNMAIRLVSRAALLLVGSIFMAFFINWQIALIFVISTPLIVLVLYAVMKSTLPRYTNIQKGQDTLGRISRENLEGTRVIRAFARQRQEKEEFDTAADDLSDITIRVGKISALLNPLTTLIINAAIIVIIWLGADFVFRGDLMPGNIIALVSYMNQTLLALIVAANIVVLLTRCFASMKRVAAVFATQPAIADGPGAKEKAGAPVLQFEDVSFSYPDAAEPALSGISFTLPRGSTMGIIGGTGSGKSTLAELIPRSFDASIGQVLVNGAPVGQYTLHTLRDKISLVPQKAALLSGSIRYNLQLANPQATDAELWRALELAQASEFVEKLPDGLDTEIAEGGKNLSGGQKQRLTIARALARRPELLILDDSSSALDYATDAKLRAALKRETGSGAFSAIIISQRAASIKHADSILVLDDGRMAGLGSHEQLLKTCEIYREICTSQGLTNGEVGA